MVRYTLSFPYTYLPAVTQLFQEHFKLLPDFHSIRLPDMQVTQLYDISPEEPKPYDLIQILRCMRQFQDHLESRGATFSDRLFVPELGYQPRKVG